MRLGIKDLISMRRYETFTLHTILQGFRISDCEWLMPSNPATLKQTRVSTSDSQKRLELLQEFSLWYFEWFLIPLLRVRKSIYFKKQGLSMNISRRIFTLQNQVHSGTKYSTFDKTTGTRCANR
jgi:hypothetical protein